MRIQVGEGNKPFENITFSFPAGIFHYSLQLYRPSTYSVTWDNNQQLNWHWNCLSGSVLTVWLPVWGFNTCGQRSSLYLDQNVNRSRSVFVCYSAQTLYIITAWHVSWLNVMLGETLQTFIIMMDSFIFLFCVCFCQQVMYKSVETKETLRQVNQWPYKLWFTKCRFISLGGSCMTDTWDMKGLNSPVQREKLMYIWNLKLKQVNNPPEP